MNYDILNILYNDLFLYGNLNESIYNTTFNDLTSCTLTFMMTHYFYD